MATKKNVIRIVIASPSDVRAEREIAHQVARDIGITLQATLGVRLEIYLWELSAPGLHANGAQGLIDEEADIAGSDILIAIFWARIGTPLPSGETGTEHELRQAIEGWKQQGHPRVMAYFCNRPLKPADIDTEQMAGVKRARALLESTGLPRDYGPQEEFRSSMVSDLSHAIARVTRPLRQEPPRAVAGAQAQADAPGAGVLLVSGSQEEFQFRVLSQGRLRSSFWTDGSKDEFRRLRVPTTAGIVDDVAVDNEIYVIRDPLRPFEIQIGSTRASRPAANPGTIAFSAGLSIEAFLAMWPFIVGDTHKWLRLVFAELETSEDILRHLLHQDPDPEVRQTVARNPSAAALLSPDHCRFCDQRFLFGSARGGARVRHVLGSAVVIHNDFPYGPHFHYIVFPNSPVHAWDSISCEQLLDLNLAVWDLFGPPGGHARSRLRESDGIRIGLNSSIRHLIMGKSSRSSAGASIAHVHKQVWGMAQGSVNISDHAVGLCREYAGQGIDYLGRYLAFLDNEGQVIWQDERVALTVPLAQISLHELHIVVKRPNVNHYLDLSRDEVESMSRAEFIATRIYSRLGVNSFNEIVLARAFSDDDDVGFRLMVTFVTREVDLAVSELNLLYVVDKHPGSTVQAIEAARVDINQAIAPLSLGR